MNVATITIRLNSLTSHPNKKTASQIPKTQKSIKLLPYNNSIKLSANSIDRLPHQRIKRPKSGRCASAHRNHDLLVS